MILLIPTKGILNVTKIDYGLVSFIISKFVKIKKKVSLRVERSKKNYSYYDDSCKVIFINTRESCTLKYIIGTLLHEIRHYMQLEQRYNNLYFIYSNYDEYYNSPEEVDARKFEVLGVEVCKIYNQHKKIEDKYKKYELDYFKELPYTDEVNNDCLHLKQKTKKT